MVRKTVELYECDVCGKEAERFAIAFPDDGVLSLDRCERHARKLLALKEEKGTWGTPQGRSSFKVSSLGEVEKQRRQK